MDIDLQDHGYVILPGDDFTFTATGSENCLMELDLLLSDGNQIFFENSSDAQMTAGTKQFSAIINGTRTPQSQSVLSGSISCGSSYFEINTMLLTLGKIPIPSEIMGKINFEQQQQVIVEIDSMGNFTNSFRVEVNGPLSRIAETNDEIILDESSQLIIEIDPKGLLSDGMIVNGEIVLVSFSGHRWEYPVEFVAQSDSSELEQWRKPSNLLALAGVLAMLWTILGMRDTINQKKNSILNEANNTQENDAISGQMSIVPIEENHPQLDPWGRLID